LFALDKPLNLFRITGPLDFVHRTKELTVSWTGSVSVRWANLNHWTQWGPNRIGGFLPLPEDINRWSFWNIDFSSTLNSRLSGIRVGMEITINRKPG
jgi:hypothetical protein